MGIFSNPQEEERKANLKALEDKRVAFAQKLEAQGFRPERMLFAQTANGGFAAVCRFQDRQWLIVSPGFGSDDDFQIEGYERFDVRREEVLVKSEGMGGILGLGKKGQRGMNYIVTRSDGSEVSVPFVFGLNGWAEYALNRNPLLSTKRRRKDANVVWDMKPIDNVDLQKVVDLADRYFEI